MINVGSSREYSILEVAQLIQKITAFDGKIVFDKSKPDGTPRKIMDNSKLTKMGFRPKIELAEGLQKMYQWFLENYTLFQNIK